MRAYSADNASTVSGKTLPAGAVRQRLQPIPVDVRAEADRVDEGAGGA